MEIDGGWSKTPHAITNAMPQMTMPELACTMLLVRETYGWHRPRARLTYGDFTRLTNVKSKSTVAEALNLVEARGFFRRTGERSVWGIGGEGAGCKLQVTEGAGVGSEEVTGYELQVTKGSAVGREEVASCRLQVTEGSEDELRQEVAGLRRTVAELQRAVDEQLAVAKRDLNHPARQAERSLPGLQHIFDAVCGTNIEPEGSAWETEGPQIELNGPGWGPEGSEFEQDGSAWHLEGSEIEIDGSSAGAVGAEIEIDGSFTGAVGSETEPGSSVFAVEGSEIGPFDAITAERLDDNSPANGPKIMANGSIGGRSHGANGSFPGSSLLYKDKGSPSGIKREGERKEIPRPPEAPTAGPVLKRGGPEDPQAGPNKDPAKGAKGVERRSKHTTPRPRSKKQILLASHPAAAAWLEVGLEWPGWKRMKVITQRIGAQPQLEKLRQARQMWLMAGYRMDNVDGILDWYEGLCGDAGWRPFGRGKGENW